MQINQDIQGPQSLDSERISPVKIGSQIVGSNHFNDYDIRVDQ